jgi:hypothetical protein
MNRAVRWLLLAGLVLGTVGLMGHAAQAQSGITVTFVCNQYLRAEPDEDASRVGLMNPGDTHLAVGRFGGWLYIQINPNLDGWAYYGNCMSLNGEFDSLPVIDPIEVVAARYSGPPSASLLCTQYLRREPSPAAESIMIMTGADAPLSISARTADSAWMLVTTASGQVGWTSYTDCVQVTGNFYSVPVASDAMRYSGGPALDVVCTQYVRAQPSMDSTRVAIMQPTDDLWTINGRDLSGSWFLVSNAVGDINGWTANSDTCVNLLGDFNAIPIFSEDIITYEGSPVATLACAQNLRAYPSTDGRKLAVLDSTVGVMDIIARSTDVGWVYVRTADGFEGWTSTGECLTVQGNVLELPVQTADASYEGPPVVVLSCSQYLRSMPDQNAQQVAILQPADGPLPLLARTDDAGWLYLQLPDGTAGWTANASCAGVRGSVYEAPEAVGGAVIPGFSGQPTARIQCAQYLRAEPEGDAARLAIMNPGDGVYSVEARTSDSSWLYLRSDSFSGWAAWGDCLDVQGFVQDIPVLDQDETAYTGDPVATVACTQYLRSGPSTDSSTLDPMPAGTQLDILGRSQDGSWVYVRQVVEGSEGWTALGSCLSVMGNVYSRPVVSNVDYDGPPIATVNCSQFLREQPDDSSEKVAVLNGGEGVLRIVARDVNGSWMQILMQDGTLGWAATGVCLDVQGDFFAVPVYETGMTYTGAPIATVQCSQYCACCRKMMPNHSLFSTGRKACCVSPGGPATTAGCRSCWKMARSAGLRRASASALKATTTPHRLSI